MPDQSKEVELPFPGLGLDVSTAFSHQTGGTTPHGQNVRTFERDSLRGRGGTRCGLNRFINAQVSGENLIQCIGFVVSTSTEALTDSDNPETSDTDPNFFTDPSTGDRNPGRRVRRGGSGRQPNRNTRRTFYTGKVLRYDDGTTCFVEVHKHSGTSDAILTPSILLNYSPPFDLGNQPVIGRDYDLTAVIDPVTGNITTFTFSHI